MTTPHARALLQARLFQQSRSIYYSTARKLERSLAKDGVLPTDPYFDERDGPFWRRVKYIAGSQILLTVMTEVFRLHGWEISVLRDGNYANGRHVTVTIHNPYPWMPAALLKVIDLPVLDVPTWCPRRMGGIWTVFDLKGGKCSRDVYNLIREYGQDITEFAATAGVENVMPGKQHLLPVLASPHVYRMADLPVPEHLKER